MSELPAQKEGDLERRIENVVPTHDRIAHETFSSSNPNVNKYKQDEKVYLPISDPRIPNSDPSPSSPPKEGSTDPNIVTWDSPTDSANPVNWPPLLRWSIIVLVSAITFMAGLSSSMFAPSVPALMVEFHSTNTYLGSFVVTIFVLGLGTGPVVFAPLSEIYGRLPMQHVGNVGFLVFTIACAESKSLGTLIGMRLLQGIFAAVPLTNGGAVIADMVKQEERGFALAMFTMGLLLGPVVGPVCGGFLAAAKGWRWVFWVIAILLGFLTLVSVPLFRESYPPILLARKARRLRKSTSNLDLRSQFDNGLTPSAHFSRGITRAVKITIYSPIILSFDIYTGLVYSYFYLLFTTFTPIFEDNYGFSSSRVGLSYLGVGAGFMVGQVVYARFGDRISKMLAEKRGNGEMKPEYRLPLGVAGSLCVPIGFFWYGWSVQAGVHWIVPIIGTAFCGLGNCLIFISIQAYTVDAFTLYAASALASNTIVRSTMASVLPLAAPKMYATLGIGWGNSLLAFLALAMGPILPLLLVHGEKMRGWNAEKLKRL